MDQKLLFLINHQWTSPALDSFMATMSSFAAWAPVVIIVVALAAACGGFKARAMLLALGLVLAISDGVVSAAIKRMVGRPRPREAMAGVRVVDLQPAPLRILSVFKPAAVYPSPTPEKNPHGHSFPSSHTVNNFAAATVLAAFYRRRGWLYFVPAIAVGYSRIYVGAHWPSDVVLSAPLGAIVAILLLVSLESAWRRYAARIVPAIHAQHPTLLGAAI